MGFRLVGLPKSATLNDVERRKSPYFALFHPTRQFLESITSKLFTTNSYCLRQNCSSNNLVFSDIIIQTMAIFAEVMKNNKYVHQVQHIEMPFAPYGRAMSDAHCLCGSRASCNKQLADPLSQTDRAAAGIYLHPPRGGGVYTPL